MQAHGGCLELIGSRHPSHPRDHRQQQTKPAQVGKGGWGQERDFGYVVGRGVVEDECDVCDVCSEKSRTRLYQ